MLSESTSYAKVDSNQTCKIEWEMKKGKNKKQKGKQTWMQKTQSIWNNVTKRIWKENKKTKKQKRMKKSNCMWKKLQRKKVKYE